MPRNLIQVGRYGRQENHKTVHKVTNKYRINTTVNVRNAVSAYHGDRYCYGTASASQSSGLIELTVKLEIELVTIHVTLLDKTPRQETPYGAENLRVITRFGDYSCGGER